MTQPDLFHAPTLTPRERGHLGAARAARRASATWVETATAYVLTFGQQQPGPWLTEDARAFAEAAGFSTPYDGRIWGSITQSLKRAGKIQCVGYGPAASSNASPKCTWQVVR